MEFAKINPELTDITCNGFTGYIIQWGDTMVGDFSIKCKYRDAILNQIKKEINPSENDLMLMRDRLSKATSDELERTYEAFERFGVKIVMDLVRSWKIVFMRVCKDGR
mgnify:CR=1 FL=1